MTTPFRRANNSRTLCLALAVILATTGCRVRAGDAGQATAEPADFYRPDEVQAVHLQVAEEDMKRMVAALPERVYVPASFRWRDVTLKNVAVRFKGNSSSAPEQRHKRSFLIKFDEYEAGQRFLGLRRVSFDNGVQFGSVFSEPIVTEILREQGVKAHRSNFARLFLNGEYRGVYVNVERVDETFTQRAFSDPDGLLFKVDEGGPGANLQYLGADPSAYGRAFEPETKAAKGGRHRLVEFLRTLNEAPGQDFAATLGSKLEVDEFLRVTAVMLFSGAFDQLTGWNPHNYYLFCDSRTGRWRYLPWDLDVGFCEVAFGHIHALDDWNAAWPVAGQLPNPLLDRIVADPDLLRRYRAVAREILEKSFEPERLCSVIDSKYALVKSDLLADPFPHRRATNPEDQNYDGIVASMKQFVRKRYASARRQLENPGKRPEVVRRPGDPRQLVEKVHRLERAAGEMRRAGKDVRPIQELMGRVGPLMQKGRVEEAEGLVNKALELAGAGPGDK